MLEEQNLTFNEADSEECVKRLAVSLDLTDYTEIFERKMDSFSNLHPVIKPKMFCTVNPPHRIKLTWKIRNFSMQPSTVYSASFCMAGLCASEYQCALVSSDSKEHTRDLELRRCDDFHRGITVHSEFTVSQPQVQVVGENKFSEFLPPSKRIHHLLSIYYCNETHKKKPRRLDFDQLILSGFMDVRNCCIRTKFDDGENSDVLEGSSDLIFNVTLITTCAGSKVIYPSNF